MKIFCHMGALKQLSTTRLRIGGWINLKLTKLSSYSEVVVVPSEGCRIIGLKG